jgi:hypothetical protein
MQIYKASIPAATTHIPAPITSNAFIAEAALLAAGVAVPVEEDLAVVEPDFVAVEDPLLLEEEAPAQISAETVAVSITDFLVLMLL